MTFTGCYRVTEVFGETEDMDDETSKAGIVVLAEFEGDAGPTEALIGGEIRLVFAPGRYEVPSKGDVLTVNGWFATRYDEPPKAPSDGTTPIHSTDA